MSDYTFPVIGDYRISSGIGPRSSGVHNGIDIAAITGSPVIAPTALQITVAQSGISGYGNAVYGVDDAGNRYEFGHLDTIGVNVGDTIPAGYQLGTVGSTGRSTGPHLHVTVRDALGNFLPNLTTAVTQGEKVSKPSGGGGLLGKAIKGLVGLGKGLAKCGPNPACLAAEGAKEAAQELANQINEDCGINPVCYLRKWWTEIDLADRLALFVIGAILIIAGLGIFVLQSGNTKQILTK